jgi:hypothetical protein
LGKKSSKSKTTTSLPSWAQPLATGAGNQILNTVSGNQGNLSQQAGQIRSYLPQLGNMAFGQQPGLQAANGYAQDVLGGKYLDSNPYMDSMVHQGEQDAANQVNSSFSMAGRTGGGANQQALARGVMQAGDALRYGNYAQERQNQTAAAGLVPQLTQAQYAGIMPYLAAQQTAGQLPYAGISNLGQIGGLYGGTGTTSSTQPGGWGGQVLSAAAAALPFLSDRRLKKNIEKVGEAKDGLGIYEYEYTFDPEATRYRGVMADEVKALRPEAYLPKFRGEYDGVNYAALGSLA